MRPFFTMTAPTIGFGNVRPRAFFASASAPLKYSTSRVFTFFMALDRCEFVTKLALFRRKVAPIHMIRRNLERHAPYDRDAVLFYALYFVRTVRQQCDAPDAEIAQNVGGGVVATQIRIEAECVVRLHGIESARLLGVRPYLIGKSDPPPFLIEIEQNSAASVPYRSKAGVQLLSAIAGERAECVTGQTLRMYAHEHRPLDVA